MLRKPPGFKLTDLEPLLIFPKIGLGFWILFWENKIAPDVAISTQDRLFPYV
jgi:hypothetical protein